MRRLLVAVLAVLLVSAAAGGSSEDVPRVAARAWAVWVSVPGQDPVEIASTAAELGSNPTATAVPVAVAGQGPDRIRADRDTPIATGEAASWVDPSGSVSLAGGTAEARATAGNAAAQATIAAGTGSGFALADQLLTWEQQEQLLGTWGDANAALFDALNQVLGRLSPLLGARNLQVPPLEPMAPLGFVDVAGVQQLTSRTEVVASTGYRSATASSDVARARLFGGFIEIDDLSALASTERLGADTSGHTEATLGRLRIAGIDVLAGQDGLVAAGNDLLPRETLQPILDGVLDQLAAAGVSLRVAQERVENGVREISGVDLVLPTPTGEATVSIGHAEVAVTAASPPAPQPATVADVPAALPPASPAEPTLTVTPPVAPSVAATPPLASAAVSSAPSGQSTSTAPPTVLPPDEGAESVPVALRLAPPGPQAARSFALAYLLLVGGLLGGAVLVPAVASRRTPTVSTRRRPR